MIMKRMKCKRVHGVDWIDAHSLKIAGPLIEESLLHLINLSIRKSSFANRWKPQLIFPFHKKKAKDEIGNYRPVSHLVQVGKIVEYAVNFQIIEHFTRNDLFHPNHHGSLAHHSTATAVIQLFDIWLEAAERQELSAACLLDQSAAYDLLCHKILKEKLKLYNFDESSIAWIMSYLGGRTQLVQVESKTSDPLDCQDHGVPQGSVLGGLLHIINSNDLPACHEEGEPVVYVDDDSDTVSAEDQVSLKILIQQEARNSAEWLTDNRLCVAGDKSKLLVIGTRKLRKSKLGEKMTIEVDGKEIMESESEKLLGLVVNNELTWRNHLYGDADNGGLIPQLAQRIGVLRRLSKKTGREKLKLFSFGIFYSKLNYCLPVFGNLFGLEKYKEESNRYTSFTIADNMRLQVLQNQLNRLLTGALYNTPTKQLLIETNSLSVQQMIAFQTGVMSFKIMQSKKPTYLACKMQEKTTSMSLRGRSGSVSQHNHSLSIAKEGFIHRGLFLFNMLDENLRCEKNLKKFKTDLRKWVKANIPIKPKPKIPTLGRRPAPPPPPTAPAPTATSEPASQSVITQYFQLAPRTSLNTTPTSVSTQTPSNSS